jgi:hypothetical protein
MHRSSKKFRRSDTGAEIDAVQYDDGGSGLFEACQARFASSGCEITCDARHSVWVKRADGTRWVGLAGWLLNRYSMEELLDSVEARLDLTLRAR